MSRFKPDQPDLHRKMQANFWAQCAVYVKFNKCSHAPQFICDHKVEFVIFHTRFKITWEHEEMGENTSSKIQYSSTRRKIFFHLSQSVGVRKRLGSTLPNAHHVSSSVKSYLEVRKEPSLQFVISNFANWIPGTKYNYACNDFQKYKED
jgi:hypothetical protein